ncbi:MAG: TonB-dependent receptor plug domain-containing protein [Planctomycetota bacterium]|jgi:outer membrane receptor protein involved in Fe transport
MNRILVLFLVLATALSTTPVFGRESAGPAPKAPEGGKEPGPEKTPEEEEKEKEKTVSLGDVIVTPHKTLLTESLDEKLLLASDAKNLPLIDNDLMRAAQLQPGVEGDDFSARFGVRGGERDETLVLLDGMELYDPFHLQDYGGAISIIDMLAVSRAEFYLGGFPAEYGDKLSAVLDVRTRPARDRFTVDTGIDLLNAHFFLSRAPVLAAVRAGYIGLLMGMMDSEESFSPHYGDALLKFTHRLSERDEISAYLLYAVDTNRIDEPKTENDVRSRYHNGMSWVRWRTTLGGETLLDSFLYGGWASRRRRAGTQDFDERELSYFGAKTVLEAPLDPDLLLKAGLDFRHMDGRYDYEDTDDAIDIRTRVRAVSVKGFVSGTWKVSPLLTAEAGSRVISLSSGGGCHFGPTLALSFHAGEALTFRGAWGMVFQPVDPLHLPVEAGIDEITRPEKATHVIFGVQYKEKKAGLNTRVEIYYKVRDDLVGQIPDFGRTSQIFWPKDDGTAWGVELLLDKELGSCLIHLAYTYAFSKETYQGREYFSDQDQRYACNLGWRWAPGQGWSVYAGWRYHSGRPYTRIWYEGTTRHLGPRNDARYPPYHSLDLRAGKVFDWRGMKIEVYLQILNLYNRQNVHEYSFTETVENGQTVYVRKEEHLFPILPSIGLNLSF